MSDVVKGLREAASGKGGLDYGDLWAYCDEAADEIERLEAELATERARADKATAQYEALASTMGWLDRLPLVDRALNAEAERDRLREAIQTALGDVCGISLCEINSMSSRQEMGRLARQAAETLRAALEGKP